MRETSKGIWVERGQAVHLAKSSRRVNPRTEWFDAKPPLPVQYAAYETQAPSKDLTMPKPRRRRKIGSKKRHSKWKARHHIQ